MLSHSSGGQKAEITVLTGSCPSEGEKIEGSSLPLPAPGGSWGLLGAPGVAGLAAAHSDLCITLPAFRMAPVIEHLVFVSLLLIYVSMQWQLAYYVVCHTFSYSYV